jgi:diguanylate cyclase (GGDEF)-like protein
MGKIYRTKIFRRLFLSILTTAIVNFVVLYLILFYNTRAFIDARQLEIAAATLGQVSRRLLEWLDGQKEVMAQLASNLAIDLEGGLGETLFDRRLDACRGSRRAFLDVFTAGRDGRIAHLSSTARPPEIDVADRDYFRASMAGRVYVSGFFVERIRGSLSLAVSAPILASGAGAGADPPTGVVAGLLGFDAVTNVVSGFSAMRDFGSVLVLDAESRRLVDSASLGATAAPLRTRAAVELAARRSGSAMYADADGRPVYGSYSWLGDLGLGLVVEISIRTARQSLLDSLAFVLYFMGLLAVALAIDSWILSLKLLAPIGRLSEAAEQLAANRFPAPLGLHTGTELDGIGDCFDRMAQAVRARESELIDSAARDSLTGLYNHAKIEERLDLELSGRRRHDGGPVALVMLDLDQFKSVNDTYGHAVGDEVLRSVARIIEGTSREADFVGRYGGEEFAVILRGPDSGEIGRYCERLRAAVAAATHEAPAGDAGAVGFSVTASIGWAQWRAGAETPARLIRRADAGLYAAKAAGRDCVREGELADGGPSLQNAPDRG